MDSGERPLLSTGDQEGPTPEQGTNYDNDIDPINGVEDFVKKFLIESKKLWRLAGPTILLYLCQYSLGAITQVFAGQVGVLDLAAFAYENLVIAGFSSGILYGMGSAVETLCGQAFGAGRVDMLGVYLQRSWIILLATSLVLCFLYIFAEQLLKFLGESDEIAKAAGDFAPWMLPQLFAYALNYPISKFLQSQRKMMVMCYISAVALILHTVFSWLLMLKLGWGLVGAAVVLNVSWWFIVVAQLLYILSGSCGRAWSGLSWEAFHNLWEFLKLSIASAVMLSMNILAWALMVFLGFNAGIRGGCWSRMANVGSLCEYWVQLHIWDSFSLVLGLKLGLGVEGIWSGMLSGTMIQTCILFIIIYRTDWNKEASVSGDRIRKWGGDTASAENDIEK
ncbi:Protein detoxification 30 [Vitis vinifera]|uniref:Protein detoxification 30 n=1 Tax=Vitis vinifera TaxID=29760 RepID=A0A438E6Y9_VITVI|nr:Protein detoxification 30 [Vitis vinifera]